MDIGEGVLEAWRDTKEWVAVNFMERRRERRRGRMGGEYMA